MMFFGQGAYDGAPRQKAPLCVLGIWCAHACRVSTVEGARAQQCSVRNIHTPRSKRCRPVRVKTTLPCMLPFHVSELAQAILAFCLKLDLAMVLNPNFKP